MLKPLVFAASCSVSAHACAGGITGQYGYDFLPIRDAGNAPWTYFHPDHGQLPLYGGVDYEYRISDTVTTATQWAAFLTDFVTAFGSGTVAGVSYDILDNTTTLPGGDGIIPSPGFEQHTITTPWRGAAIYCNWLHHGQTSDPNKLMVGAYDATTFGEDGAGNPTDQTARLEGAKFWIPTRDELMKAAYYDPNRYGEGESGYWNYPNAGDEPLIGAFPEDGGETNAFTPPGPESAFLPVRSYPDTMSAYGLLDMSGMVVEFTSTETESTRMLFTTLSKQRTESSLTDIFDLVNVQATGTISLDSGRAGFRIATSIPTPSTLALLGLGAIGFARRRR